jgi:hypothetical protein
MPQPRGRRHPLFLRLTKPIEPIYPRSVAPVAWDDDEPLDEVEGVVYIVTRHCARMRTWARQLRKLHGADETYKTEEGISSLSAAPLREANHKASSPSSVRISNRVVEMRMRAGSVESGSALVERHVCVLLCTKLPGRALVGGVEEEGIGGSVSACSLPSIATSRLHCYEHP